MELRVRSRVVRGATVIEAEGDLDLSGLPRLREALSNALNGVSNALNGDGKATCLVLDMTGVDFLDSSGLGAIVGAFKRAREAGGGLALAAPSPRVCRVLEIAGLVRVLPLFATLEEALDSFDAIAPRGED